MSHAVRWYYMMLLISYTCILYVYFGMRWDEPPTAIGPCLNLILPLCLKPWKFRTEKPKATVKSVPCMFLGCQSPTDLCALYRRGYAMIGFYSCLFWILSTLDISWALICWWFYLPTSATSLFRNRLGVVDDWDFHGFPDSLAAGISDN